MIIVKLTGGLGNQLFQYAFGRSLSTDLKTDLYFDLSHYDGAYSKSIIHDFYNLNHFKINQDELKFLNNIQIADLDTNYYTESSFNEITEFPTLKNLKNLKFPAHFDGFWQSEKYFIHHENIIKKDLQFKNPIKGKNKKIAKDILDHNSVAIHIRRGDYLNYTKFGTCSVDYYENAVKLIEKNVDNPKFFIFSNDHDWVKKNIHIKHPKYHVTHNDVETAHEDLRLMSLCQHFIIANSSFSWWGAWLSSNRDKIVTTPRPWLICREPNLRYIDQGKHYFPIKNDQSQVFNNSDNILFNLNISNHYADLKSAQNLNLTIDDGVLIIETLENDAKLHLKEIKKLNETNEAIIRLHFETKSDDILKIEYENKKSDDYLDNSFYSHYEAYEDINMYIQLPKEVSLKNLKIIPASTKGSIIKLKSLEIREINGNQSILKKVHSKIKSIKYSMP